MRKLSFFMGVVIFSFFIFAETDNDGKNDNDEGSHVEIQQEDELSDMIGELSAQVEELRKTSEEREKKLAESIKKLEALKTELDEMKAARSEDLERKKVEEEEKEAVEVKTEENKVSFVPYGFVELYGYANDAQFLSNDLMVYVADKNRSAVGMSARKTSLGVDISVPYVTFVDLSAKVEIDFFGSLPDTGNSETSTGLRMRHAFFKISKAFKTDTTLSLIAGQTWTTAAIPIFPNVINPAGGWGSGNIWNRLPLAELEIAQKAGNFDFGLKTALVKPISGMSANRRNFIEINIDSGSASHWPSFQGQLYFIFKIPAIEVFWAAGGAYGREDYTSGVKINNEDELLYGNEVEVWMFNTALKVVHKYAEIQGKYFMGENLDMFGFFGGSLIKENGIVIESMKAKGFWTELSLKPLRDLKISLGLGSEYTNHEQSVYDQNDSFWLSVFYTLFGHVTPGFQWQQTVTEKDGNKQTGNSFMGSLKFSF